MRIVHVSDCFAPRVGGIETQVQELAHHQARAGHAVHVLTATAASQHDVGPDRSRYRTSTTETGPIRVHRLASPWTFGVPVHPRGQSVITRALRLLRPDVVHVHAGVISPFAQDGALAARELDLPMAVTWHCVLDRMRRPLGWAARTGGWDGARFAPSAVSGLVAKQVADMLDRQDVTVVPNGLDLGPWRAVATAASQANPEPGTLRVVASQRLARRKRAVPLVRIITRAHEQLGRTSSGRPRIHLTVAGDGAGAAAIRSQIAREDLYDVVTLLGRVPRGLLPTLYRAQDVFISPARLEAFGLAALEARTAGLALVGMAGSGIAEFITHGREGLLAADDDAAAAALVTLAKDEDLLGSITAHNRTVPPSLGWADVLRRVEALYARAREIHSGQVAPG